MYGNCYASKKSSLTIITRFHAQRCKCCFQLKNKTSKKKFLKESKQRCFTETVNIHSIPNIINMISSVNENSSK